MRILLLSLYYPPLNTIASTRVKAFEEYLGREGHAVDVITRYYDEEQRKGTSMFVGSEEPKDFSGDYTREGNVIYTNFTKSNSRSRIAKLLPPGVKGLYNYLGIDNFHYGWIDPMLKAYEKELSNNKYDFIIASFGPPVSTIAANLLPKKYKIPFLIDFRDAYIDERDHGLHYRMKRMVQQRFLKKAAAIIFATEGMKDYFFQRCGEKLSDKKHCIVYNGVPDDADRESVPAMLDEPAVKKFETLLMAQSHVLLHTGTLYKGQNIDFFIDGVEKYNRDHGKNAAIVFLGLSENGIQSLPSRPFIHFINKVNISTSVYLQKKATALLLPIWNGRYTGFSGKTQEYIYSGNFVVTSPEPQKDLLSFFNISPNIAVANDTDSFCRILEEIGSGERKKQVLTNPGPLYRSYWIKKLSGFLQELKNTKNK